MKLYESAEMYLETILVLSKKHGSVRSIDVAGELEVSKPSVSIAMKKLRENGYVNMDSDGAITLTDKGLNVAQTMYERHTLLTAFLIRIGISEETAADDACRMEHVISQETFEKIRDHLTQLGTNS